MTYMLILWISTDGNDGTIHHERIGTCTKPSQETTFGISYAN